MEPVILKPIWKNNRCGDGRVAKRLDRFLISERIVDNHHLVRQWIGSGDLSDHSPIFLELREGPNKLPCPLKFNKTWLQDESFIALITDGWVNYRLGNVNSASFHFAANLRHLKALIKPWAHEKRIRDAQELTQIEADIAAILTQEGGGLKTHEEFAAL